MQRIASIWRILLFFALAMPLFADGESREIGEWERGLQGYAGPGWSILFGTDRTTEMASLGPVMFRISEKLYLGPLVAYEESSPESPGPFLGGVKAEGYLVRLSHKFYSTSVGFSVLAGAEDLNNDGHFAAQINTELNANILLFPSLCLGVGPMLSLRLGSSALTFLPGVTVSLKEGTAYRDTPLIYSKEDGPRIGGYWQGLWLIVNQRTVFIDGGGTRIEFPKGVAFGITGGVLRQSVQQSGSDLTIMVSGLTAEWNGQFTSWLTVTPRVASGLAMYGWIAPDGSIEGDPHFIVRPELCAYLRVFPFMSIGGGVGYQFVSGQANTSIPLDPLSSVAFSVQVRVGEG